jgi:hypothetical protein
LLLDGFEISPLAIAQAARHIRETRISLGKYLELFHEYEQNQVELLSEALPNALAIESASPTAPRAVMMTWKVTMDKIQRDSPLSFRLLQLMSFLDPAEIPEELIKSASFLENESMVHFNEAVTSLLSFGLLYLLESSKYRLHRFCMRVRMDMEPDGEEHLISAVGLVYDCWAPYRNISHAPYRNPV